MGMPGGMPGMPGAGGMPDMGMGGPGGGGGGAGGLDGLAYGRRNVRLPPEVNRILYVRNLPYKITPDELYDVFGKFAVALRQIQREQHLSSMMTFMTRRTQWITSAASMWLAGTSCCSTIIHRKCRPRST